MYGDPALWNDLCARLAQISGAFLRVQAEAGASAVQLFDSWVGALPLADYQRYVQSHSTAALAAVENLGSPHPLRGRNRGAAARHGGGGRGRRRCRLQGLAHRGRASPRPVVCGPGQPRPGQPLAPWPALAEQVRRIVAEGGARATSSTSVTACCPRPTPDVLTRVVELVHEVSAR